MAAKLGVAISFLSAVENGKKGMPSGWGAKITSLYSLSEDQRHELDVSVAESEKGIGVKFDGLPSESRQISAAFARRVKTLNKAEREKLKEILF